MSAHWTAPPIICDHCGRDCTLNHHMSTAVEGRFCSERCLEEAKIMAETERWATEPPTPERTP